MEQNLALLVIGATMVSFTGILLLTFSFLSSRYKKINKDARKCMECDYCDKCIYSPDDFYK